MSLFCLNVHVTILILYLAAKNKTQQKRNSQLCVTEEYNIKKIWIRRRLQEEPEIYTKYVGLYNIYTLY